MNVGTAKPTKKNLEEADHYLIDNKSIHDSYDVKAFEKDALVLIERLFNEMDMIILTGGSGLYIDAVVGGLDEMPPAQPQIREQLNLDYRRIGLVYLQKKLLELDPDYYAKVDLNNPQRLIRALEVCLSTGKPYSHYRVRERKQRPFRTIKLALCREREELYSRIEQRMDAMIRQGLFEEAAGLYPYRRLNALQTVGYQEIFGYMEGDYDKTEAIRLLKRNSRRYAKRQLTWFRRDPDYTWFHPEKSTEIISWVTAQMSR
ncbi:tRNA dimethylallyltransferase [Cyclobacterium lianum]|uniref:tRNA dimethylallyltransferase n=2 Tax=Cyclobacterium lianum TaxID=388280 RepID=A0A1M7N984_9BACT|nr:tRNA dimethylallyltransferase [Cyclobacterium lianum]